MALAELRNRLFGTEEEPDVPWLENILRALERDCLIEREQAIDRIRLHS